MKIKSTLTSIALSLLALSTLNSQLSTALAQGSLTPPGAPASTMKTLAQIEPRGDVLKLSGDGLNLFAITNSGSFYLTTNITGVAAKYGIGIYANNVTLDLNGFALSGVPGSFGGIAVWGSYTNLTVRNGVVSGWGNSGVDVFASVNGLNATIERLQVSGNGGAGIVVPPSSIVSDCLSLSNHSDGINSQGGLVRSCTVRNNGGNGVFIRDGQVRDCVIQFSSQAGINCGFSVVRDCKIDSSGNTGISLAGPSQVTGCQVLNSASSGIYVTGSSCRIIGNTCITNNASNDPSRAGIEIQTSDNRIEDNSIAGSGAAGSGILVSGGRVNNVIIKNIVSGNGGNNYNVPIANDLGPVGTAMNSTSPWANISH